MPHWTPAASPACTNLCAPPVAGKGPHHSPGAEHTQLSIIRATVESNRRACGGRGEASISTYFLLGIWTSLLTSLGRCFLICLLG